MAIVRTQSVEAISNPGSGLTTVAVTITAPAADSLIICGVAIDKSSGTITVPTGFTLANDYVSSSVSGALAFKVSDGTETTLTWNWVTGVANANTRAAVYTGLTTTPLDVKAEADSGASSVTSQSTGTTATTAQADELAIAFMTVDSVQNVDTGRAWSNSFTEFGFSSDVSLGVAGHSIADKTLTATGTVETTFSTTDTGDQMWATVVTFKAAGVAAPNPKGPLGMPLQGPLQRVVGP